MTRQAMSRYDVIVAGGGAAGVGAAVAAARRGARTLLVERYAFLGGAATTGNVLSYCGYFVAGDVPRPAVGGVGAAVLATLEGLGFDTRPVRAPSGNWIVMIDPEAVKLALDRIVVHAGVDCRLHCTLVGAHGRAGRLEAVTLYDHAGRHDVEAKAFVDASGDADLGFAAGVATIEGGRDGRRRQVASFPVRFGGVPDDVTVDRAALAARMASFADEGERAFVRSNGGHFLRLPQSHDLWWMGIDVVTGGLEAGDLADAERRARTLAWRFRDLLRSGMPGFEGAFIAATGPQLGIRDSRQLHTRYRMTDDDVLSGRRRDDGVALGCWPAETHPGGGGGPRFAPVGGDGTYHIPLDALRASQCDNLWVGGRVIGCDESAYGSLRVMGTAFATGQAAGVAAASCADAGGTAPDAAHVRRLLVEQDAIV